VAVFDLMKGMRRSTYRFEGKDLTARSAAPAKPGLPAGQIRRLTEAGGSLPEYSYIVHQTKQSSQPGWLFF